VKGLVASLISLAPEEYNKSTALEIAAGGRLYNVVVDNERVGKELLQNGRLRKRVTIIPLNKINARMLSKEVSPSLVWSLDEELISENRKWWKRED
jgi:structural maintenance of chromosome 2